MLTVMRMAWAGQELIYSNGSSVFEDTDVQDLCGMRRFVQH